MKILTTLLFTLLQCLNAQSQWKGQVVDVSDGDTYEIKKRSGKKIDVRLYGIVCPESDQSYGTKVTSKVSDKILYENVKVKKVETGPYDRLIGKVYYNSKMINEWLVKKGLAWVSGKYCDQSICDKWKDIQQRKRVNEVGLWSQSSPSPPWEFR